MRKEQVRSVRARRTPSTNSSGRLTTPMRSFLTTTQLITLSGPAPPRARPARIRRNRPLPRADQRPSPSAQPSRRVSLHAPVFHELSALHQSFFHGSCFHGSVLQSSCLRHCFHCSPASLAPPASSFQPGPCEPLDVAATAAFSAPRGFLRVDLPSFLCAAGLLLLRRGAS